MQKITIFIFIILGFCLILNAQTPKPYLIELAKGLSHPIDIKHCGDDRLFFVEQKGQIFIMDKSGKINSTPFLNIDSIVLSAAGEQGLLGLAFSPNYKKDGYFYVNFVTGTGNGTTIIARYSVNPLDSNVALANSKLILLEIPQPGTSHNGGNIMFGKDGYLYIFMGDGGGGNFSQNMTSLHSKIIRIDPSKQSPYSIPPDNPFVGQANIRPEIWAGGLRNPWRCSFDKFKGDLWIADVGQDSLEEINFQIADSKGGQNYGWRCYEGSRPFNLNGCVPKENFHFPAFEYKHGVTTGCSVTGGYVYRGSQFEHLFGRYLFTDACTGKLWSIQNENNQLFKTDSIGNFPKFNFITFGEDNEGELYAGSFSLMQAGTGRIWKLQDSSSCKPVAFFSFSDTLISTSKTLTLEAVYGKNLRYQWIFNGIDLPNDTLSKIEVIQDGLYSVRVTKNNCFNISNTTFVKLSSPNIVVNNKDLVNIIVKPNPSSEMIQIAFEKFQPSKNIKIEIKIYDILGTTIYIHQLFDQASINIHPSHLNPGIYFLEVTIDNRKYIKKIIRH